MKQKHEIDLYNIDFTSLTEQKMKDLCKTYIDFIKSEIANEDYAILQFDLENNLESEFDYLRGYIDHLQYKTETEILFTIGNILETYNILFLLGTNKRFKVYMHTKDTILEKEVDTIKELFDYCFPYIKDEFIHYELLSYQRHGIQIPKEFAHSDVTVKDLYNFISVEKLYIMQYGIETLYVLSQYEHIPLLCDSTKMDSIAENLKIFYKLKDTRHKNQVELTFDFLTDYSTLILY